MRKTKIHKILALSATSIMLAVMVFVASSFRSTALAAPITDKQEAATICRSRLPQGSSNVSFDYCAYTAPGAESPCVVSSSGSFPSFSNTCATLSLSAMVGQEPDDIVALALAGGGTPTQPGGGSGSTGGGTAPVAASTEKDCTGDDLSQDCKVVEWLVLFVNVLSGMVGVVVVIMIIVAGIQYTASGDDPQAVAKAKTHIYNAVLALVLFIFGFAVLQWVIPGGLLK